MARIPKDFDHLPIGRRITRKISGVGKEAGVVVGLKLASVPGWTCIYHVKWETPDKKSFAEELALTTIQSYYSDSDTYVDEPYVADDVRLKQKYDWDDTKCPNKGTKAWEEAVQEMHRNSSTTKSPSKVSKGKKALGTKHLAAIKDAAKASGAEGHQAKKQKTSTESPGIARQIKANVMNAANRIEDTLREAPQVLGQAISDALPKSSKKVSTSKPTGSTGTTGTTPHRTKAAQKAQDAIQAMSPARGSGTGQASKKQGAVIARRTSARHLPQTVTAGESDENVDIEGDKASCGLAQNLKQIASSLSAAPSSQAQTSEQGPSFKATRLHGQAGSGGAASPPDISAAGPGQDGEEMLELPAGSCPRRIPKSLTIKKDDVLVEEYTAADYDAGAEYVVDFIIAEKIKGKKMEYLVKWKGYELDPSEWTPRANLEEVEALEVWLNRNKHTPTGKSTGKGSKQAITRKSGRR